MQEQGYQRDDYELKKVTSNFELDPVFGIPVLKDKQAHLDLQKRLLHPDERDFEAEDLDFYQIFTNDNYTPGREREPTIEGAYCNSAEGTLEEAGWNAIVHEKMVSSVCVSDTVRVTELTFDCGTMQFNTIHSSKKILLKRNWKEEHVSLPTGLFFEKITAYICSPVVIALYYDHSGMPRFIYDKFRSSRSNDSNKADGFVWKIRPSSISSITKLKLQLHLLLK